MWLSSDVDDSLSERSVDNKTTLELTNDERERLSEARNSLSMPKGVWFDAGEASDARVMRRTS